jgi:hypothetical protein
MANALKASGAVLNDKVEFKNTPGFLVQAGYVRNNLAFDLRYTALEYEVEGAGCPADGSCDPRTVDASSIGVGMSFLFGRSSSATTSSDAARRRMQRR